MSSLTSVIKEIVRGYVSNLDISDLQMGSVVSENPIKVKIENGMVLPKSLLIIPEKLVREEYRVSYYGEERTMIFRDKKLKVGDSVIMVKGVGGGKYLVIDRVI